MSFGISSIEEKAVKQKAADLWTMDAWEVGTLSAVSTSTTVQYRSEPEHFAYYSSYIDN